jgi:hypothetical protein
MFGAMASVAIDFAYRQGVIHRDIWERIRKRIQDRHVKLTEDY